MTQTWMLPETYALARAEAEVSLQTIGAWLAEAVERRLVMDAQLRALTEREGPEFRPLEDF